MVQVAIYGKGGIGKSTIAANVSYALADGGKRVMQIGCDPKHDSTRALLGGREQVTVLSYIRETAPYDRRLKDVVLDGVKGIKCVEAGGPEPGIGCAGRGILTTFDTLKKLGLDDLEFDVKLYDVLGDVVCGGFAVPLRNEYADAVYLVTSGEFMSIYAANNILKGIMNFDKGVPRVAGIVLNCRGTEGELEAVKRFADAVGLPIIATVPRSRLFAEAEASAKTVMELFPRSDEAREMRKVSDDIARTARGDGTPRYARPLSDLQMGQLAKGEAVASSSPQTSSAAPSCRACSKPRGKTATEDRIICSCAAAGAVHGCSTVSDAITIVHGPRSCAHIMSASKGMGEITKGRVHDGRALQSRRIVSTDMDDTVSVFGGNGLLEQKIRDVVSEGWRNIIVVTTCVPGIIGDRAVDIAGAISKEVPGLFVRVVEADGNMIGDWSAGYAASADVLLDAVDGSVGPVNDAVNIIGERYFFKQDGLKDTAVIDLFGAFGIEVNCRLMYESSMGSLRNFRRGRMNFMMDNDEGSRMISALIRSKLGLAVDPEPLPIGIVEYRAFAEKIGREFGIPAEASGVLEREEEKYRLKIAGYRERLAGKRVLIFDKFTQNIDWLIELLLDMGTEIVAVGVGPTYRWAEKRAPSRYADAVLFKNDYSADDLLSDVRAHSPDIVLSDSIFVALDGVRSLHYVRPAPGLRGALEYGRNIADLAMVPAREGWRDVPSQ